jgi:hypothetical protein
MLCTHCVITYYDSVETTELKLVIYFYQVVAAVHPKHASKVMSIVLDPYFTTMQLKFTQACFLPHATPWQMKMSVLVVPGIALVYWIGYSAVVRWYQRSQQAFRSARAAVFLYLFGFVVVLEPIVASVTCIKISSEWHLELDPVIQCSLRWRAPFYAVTLLIMVSPIPFYWYMQRHHGHILQQFQQNYSVWAAYWDFVLVLRRGILVAVIPTFLATSDFKELALAFFCLLSLAHHTIAVPFKRAGLNQVEFYLLANLVMLALLNVGYKRGSLVHPGSYYLSHLELAIYVLNSVPFVAYLVVYQRQAPAKLQRYCARMFATRQPEDFRQLQQEDVVEDSPRAPGETASIQSPRELHGPLLDGAPAHKEDPPLRSARIGFASEVP